MANLYMEEFEIKAINTAEYPPRISKGYVDDTCVITDATKKGRFPGAYQQHRPTHPIQNRGC